MVLVFISEGHASIVASPMDIYDISILKQDDIHLSEQQLASQPLELHWFSRHHELNLQTPVTMSYHELNFRNSSDSEPQIILNIILIFISNHTHMIVPIQMTRVQIWCKMMIAMALYLLGSRCPVGSPSFWKKVKYIQTSAFRKKITNNELSSF